MPSAWQSKTRESQVARGAFAGGWTAWRAGPRPRPRDPPVPTIPTQKDPRCIAAEPGKHHRSPGQADSALWDGFPSCGWKPVVELYLNLSGLTGTRLSCGLGLRGGEMGPPLGRARTDSSVRGAFSERDALMYLSPLKNINKQTRHLTLPDLGWPGGNWERARVPGRVPGRLDPSGAAGSPEIRAGRRNMGV